MNTMWPMLAKKIDEKFHLFNQSDLFSQPSIKPVHVVIIRHIVVFHKIKFFNYFPE